ncbi:Uncharacterised protein [uncultured archaeon]|nr:Uncharacterised protein [uncultured archaeon]
MDNYTAMWAIGALAVGYALLSQFIIAKIGNPKRIKEIQAESTRLSKEMQEAAKSKDERRIEALNKEYEQFMPKITEMMVIQMKPMIVILPLLFILTPAVRGFFGEFVITLPVSLPIFIQHFEKFPNWRDTFGAYGWFWICVIFAGLAISLIKGQWEKYKGNKTPEKKAEFQGPSSGKKE